MFGDEFIDSAARVVRVCCGPRCGAETEHRRIYAAVESVLGERIRAGSDSSLVAQPVMCQGYCGMGVTVVTPEGAWMKIRAASEARAAILISEDNDTCPQ